MAKRTIARTLVPTPDTRSKALMQNLNSIMNMLKLSQREVAIMKAQTTRAVTFVKIQRGLATKRGLAKETRSVKRLCETIQDSIDRLQTITIWQVVMLVTCVEAYLQDVLAAAASVDPKLMSESEQCAPYAEVITATSLETLANGLRTKWARRWLSDGGPSRWTSRLKKMGARGYPDDLGPRLELIWGIRHVVVHAAGIATADFVKRHPGVVAKAGDRVQANHHDVNRFVQSIGDFIVPTEKFFLAGYPSLGL